MEASTWLDDRIQGLATASPGWARRLRRLPGRVLRGDHAEVDFEVQALLTRFADDAWLRFFVRQLGLHSRVVDRLEIRSTEAEVKALVEQASEPALQGCPQAVLAVVGLCSWHAGRDAIASAEDRLALSDAALARLEPGQVGYGPLAEERIRALIDLGQPEEAHAACERCPVPLGFTPVRASFACGQLAAAAAQLEALQVHRPVDLVQRDIFATMVARRQPEEVQAAALLLPSAARVRPHPSQYLGWAQAASELAGLEAIDNDTELDQTLRELQDYLQVQGAVRAALEIGRMRVDLAQARRRPRAMARALQSFQRAQVSLPSPQSAARQARLLERRLSRLACTEPLPDSPEALLAQDAQPPEQLEEQLALAAERWPEDGRLAVVRFRLGQRLGADDPAGELEAFVRAQPEAIVAAMELMEALTDAGDLARLEALQAALGPEADPELRLFGRLCLAQAACAAGELARAEVEAQALLDEHPEARAARAVLFELKAARDPAQALTELSAMARQLSEAEANLRLQLALTLGDKAAAAAAAAALGDPLGDKASARIELRYPDAPGLSVTAARTGPRSALAVSLAEPGFPQRLGDRVAIAPEPVRTPLGATVYPVLGCFSEGGYRSVEAELPTEGAEDRLQQLSALGVVVMQLGDPEDRLRWRLGIGPGSPIAKVHATLTAPPGPVSCPELSPTEG